MTKLLDAIKVDFNFIKTHKLQPAWYKVLKVIILVLGLGGYLYFFGLRKTILFAGVFFVLMLIIHLVYRVKTDRWQRSWLNIKVNVDGDQVEATQIGWFYYLSIIVNLIIATLVSQPIG